MRRARANLTLVYNEAWKRGPAWQEAIQVGAGMLTAPDTDRFKAVLFAVTKKNREDIELPFGERTVLAVKARTADLVRSGADK